MVQLFISTPPHKSQAEATTFNDEQGNTRDLTEQWPKGESSPPRRCRHAM